MTSLPTPLHVVPVLLSLLLYLKRAECRVEAWLLCPNPPIIFQGWPTTLRCFVTGGVATDLQVKAGARDVIRCRGSRECWVEDTSKYSYRWEDDRNFLVTLMTPDPERDAKPWSCVSLGFSRAPPCPLWMDRDEKSIETRLLCPENVTVQQGRSASLRCHIAEGHDINLQVRVNDQFVISCKDFSLCTPGDTTLYDFRWEGTDTLIIVLKDPHPLRDQGTWTCFSLTSPISTWYRHVCRVKVEAPTVTSRLHCPSPALLYRDVPTHLYCFVTGAEPPQLHVVAGSHDVITCKGRNHCLTSAPDLYTHAWEDPYTLKVTIERPSSARDSRDWDCYVTERQSDPGPCRFHVYTRPQPTQLTLNVKRDNIEHTFTFTCGTLGSTGSPPVQLQIKSPSGKTVVHVEATEVKVKEVNSEPGLYTCSALWLQAPRAEVAVAPGRYYLYGRLDCQTNPLLPARVGAVNFTVECYFTRPKQLYPTSLSISVWSPEKSRYVTLLTTFTSDLYNLTLDVASATEDSQVAQEFGRRVTMGLGQNRVWFALDRVRCEDNLTYRVDFNASHPLGDRPVLISKHLQLVVAAWPEVPRLQIIDPASLTSHPHPLLEWTEIKMMCRALVGDPPGSLVWLRYRRYQFLPSDLTQHATLTHIHRPNGSCTHEHVTELTWRLTREDDGVRFRCAVRSPSGMLDANTLYAESPSIRVFHDETQQAHGPTGYYQVSLLCSSRPVMPVQLGEKHVTLTCTYRAWLSWNITSIQWLLRPLDSREAFNPVVTVSGPELQTLTRHSSLAWARGLQATATPNMVSVVVPEVTCETQGEIKVRLHFLVGSKPGFLDALLNFTFTAPAKEPHIQQLTPLGWLAEWTELTLVCRGDVGRPPGALGWHLLRPHHPPADVTPLARELSRRKAANSCSTEIWSELRLFVSTLDNGMRVRCVVRQPNYTGDYVMDGWNYDEVAEFKVFPRDHSGPPHVVTVQRGLELEAGDNATLEFDVFSLPAPTDAVFTQNGRPVGRGTLTSYLAGNSRYSLPLSDVRAQQTGQYQLRVSNTRGAHVSAAIEVKVKDSGRETSMDEDIVGFRSLAERNHTDPLAEEAAEEEDVLPRATLSTVATILIVVGIVGILGVISGVLAYWQRRPLHRLQQPCVQPVQTLEPLSSPVFHSADAQTESDYTAPQSPSTTVYH